MSGSEFSAQVCGFIEQYFLQSSNIILLVLDDKFRIQHSNEGFRRILGIRTPVTNQHLADYLLPESKDMLTADGISQEDAFRLNFENSSGSPLSLNCYLYKDGAEQILIGEQLMLTSDDLLDKMSVLNGELINMSRALRKKNRELEAARDKIKVLSGIVPICMHCKQIQDGEGYWNRLEQFISEHSEAQFSHCICPDCLAEHYPEVNLETDSDNLAHKS